jgi:2-polyprenyl-6-methoxyphenol hydroxylase-like FAD-dependent oxidoreductase
VPAVSNVLVAGAGLAGTAIAAHLAASGVTVDLIEVSQAPTALGSGITLQGNALRELRRLGAWDQVREQGYSFDSLGLRAPGAAGTLLAELPVARSGGPGLPATVGMPLEDAVLAELLADARELNDAVWDAFTARRFERAKAVIDASNQLGQWLLAHEQGDVPGLAARVTALVSQPA